MPDDRCLSALDRWSTLYSRYLAVRSLIHGSEKRSQAEESAIFDEADDLMMQLMIFPAPVDWVLREKFRLYRSWLGYENAIFTDGREGIGLAALEADAARLLADPRPAITAG